MRRSKEWYACLTKEEISRLFELERSQYAEWTGNGYVCGVAGCNEKVEERSWDDWRRLCKNHQEERQEIIDKAKQKLLSKGFPDTDRIRELTRRFKALMTKYAYANSDSLSDEEKRLKNTLIEFSEEVLEREKFI